MLTVVSYIVYWNESFLNNRFSKTVSYCCQSKRFWMYAVPWFLFLQFKCNIQCPSSENAIHFSFCLLAFLALQLLHLLTCWESYAVLGLAVNMKENKYFTYWIIPLGNTPTKGVLHISKSTNLYSLVDVPKYDCWNEQNVACSLLIYISTRVECNVLL